jgi:hypothetical protein
MNRSWILALSLALLARRSAGQTGAASPPLPPADRARIGEALRPVHDLGNRIWPGLATTPMPVLLVRDSTEFLIGEFSR